MRLNLTRWTLLAITALGGFSAAGDTPITRCGGDGPTPLSIKVDPTVSIVDTVGNVRDFQVWENRQQLVYRNAEDNIYRLDLESGRNRLITGSPRALTHFADPQERYLLTDVGSWFFDVAGDRRWIQFNRSLPSMEHVFWDRDDLYSVAVTYGNGGRQSLRVFRYSAGDDYTVPLCGDLTFDPGRGYALAKGHVFPTVFLYQTTSLSQGTVINLFQLNVLNCDVTPINSFKHLIDGSVQEVYHFAKQGANAVKIDHPTRNWMWDPGNGSCQFFDIGNLSPILVNRELPVIATWSPNTNGVMLYDFRYPQTRVPKTVVLEDNAVNIASIGAKDLYLTRDGKQLFVRPLLSYPASAPIYRIGLQNFLSGGPSF